MILFIVAGALIAGAYAISKFWKEIKSFIQATLTKIKELVPKNVLIAGFKTFMASTQKGVSLSNALTQGAIAAVQTFFSKSQEDGSWLKTSITKKIDESEVPADILAQFNNSVSAVEITDKVQEELHLTN